MFRSLRTLALLTAVAASIFLVGGLTGNYLSNIGMRERLEGWLQETRRKMAREPNAPVTSLVPSHLHTVEVAEIELPTRPGGGGALAYVDGQLIYVLTHGTFGRRAPDHAALRGADGVRGLQSLEFLQRAQHDAQFFPGQRPLAAGQGGRAPRCVRGPPPLQGLLRGLSDQRRRGADRSGG